MSRALWAEGSAVTPEGGYGGLNGKVVCGCVFWVGLCYTLPLSCAVVRTTQDGDAVLLVVVGLLVCVALLALGVSELSQGVLRRVRHLGFWDR
jgi:hypothetical protein